MWELGPRAGSPAPAGVPQQASRHPGIPCPCRRLLMGRLAGFSYREVVRRLRTFGFQLDGKEPRSSEGIKAAPPAFLDEKGVPLRGVIHPSIPLRSRQEVRERPSARCFYIPGLYV